MLADVGPFAGLFKLGSYREPVLVASTDSVGTKVKLAGLLGRYDSVGHDLVNHCVNDILTSGAEPLFFLDYIGNCGLSDDAKADLVRGCVEACRAAGCSLLGGETADMPGTYQDGDFDLVGFIVGVVERDAIIDGSAIREGDVLLGLPSSGLHTNGYSLVRKLFRIGIDEDADAERARLNANYPGLEGTLGEALLVPHRCYLGDLRPVLGSLHGIAHITGGGIPGNVPRVLPAGLGASDRPQRLARAGDLPADPGRGRHRRRRDVPRVQHGPRHRPRRRSGERGGRAVEGAGGVRRRPRHSGRRSRLGVEWALCWSHQDHQS